MMGQNEIQDAEVTEIDDSVIGAEMGFDISDIGDAAKGVVDAGIDIIKDPEKAMKNVGSIKYQDIVVFTSQAPLLKDTPLATAIKAAKGPLADPTLGPILGIMLVGNPALGLAIARLARDEPLAGALVKSFIVLLKAGAKYFGASIDLDIDVSGMMNALPPGALDKLNELAQQYGDQLTVITDQLKNIPGVGDIDFRTLSTKFGISDFASATGLMSKLGTQQAIDDFAKLKFDAQGKELTGADFGYRTVPTGADVAEMNKATQAADKMLAGKGVMNPLGHYYSQMRAKFPDTYWFGFRLAAGLKELKAPPADYQRLRLVLTVGPERTGFDVAGTMHDGFSRKFHAGITGQSFTSQQGLRAAGYSLVHGMRGSPASIKNQVAKTAFTSQQGLRAAGYSLVHGMRGSPASIKNQVAKTAIVDPNIREGAAMAIAEVNKEKGWFAKFLSWFGF